MLDIAYIRENPHIVKKACADKKMPADIDRLLFVDTELRKTITLADDLRAKRNKLSKPQGDPSAVEAFVEEGRKLRTELALVEEQQKELKTEFDRLMLHVPMIPADDVPVGAGEEDNVELRRVGLAREFDFQPKDHMELMEMHGMIDVPRGVKISGSRSYFLKGTAVILEMAISRMVMDLLVQRNYTPLTVPQIVRYDAMQSTGFFPVGYDDTYKIPEDDLYLIGTSEVPLVCYHQGEILSAADLPIRLAGVSTCYRREAGTYGKDTKGLYRVHQFSKVEQAIFCEADHSVALAMHNEILQNAEDVLQALELPYRVVNACTAEIGIGKVRMHEIETWMPSRNAYCETHSCSTLGDFQARRANIRYRAENEKPKFVFTLNNTAVAFPRIFIPLVENHQNKDGKIYVPRALRPYLNGREVIG